MKRLFLLLIFFTFFLISCSAQEWINLKPLVTTKNEVRKIYDKPSLSRKGWDIFETKEGKISIFYSHGYCREKELGIKWNVGPNLVESITISPPALMSLQEVLNSLNLTLSSLSKIPHPYGDRFYYISEDRSKVIQIYIDRENKLELLDIQIYPPKSRIHLLCKDSYRPELYKPYTSEMKN